MSQVILKNLIEISNNSHLTIETAQVLSKLTDKELAVIQQWTEHAKREQENKIRAVRRRPFAQAFSIG